jgi:hypothetical protein
MPGTASTTDPAAVVLAIVALLIGLGVLALLVLVPPASATRNGA